MRETMRSMTEEVSLVPIWPEFVVPTLQVLADGQRRHRREIFDLVAAHAEVSDAVRSETLKSGGSRYEQRVGWVLSHLSKAQWLDRPARGYYRINAEGRKALATYPNGFDHPLARQVFVPFWRAAEETSVPKATPAQAGDISDPIEDIEDAVERIEENVGQDLLQRLRESHPDFFEQAVVDLLIKMGYGGGLPNEGEESVVVMMRASTGSSTKTP